MKKILDITSQRAGRRAIISLTRIIAVVAVLSLFLSPRPLYASGNNLAASTQGAIASASHDNTSASLAIDGDPDTYWDSGNPQEDSWLMVDLGSYYYIDSVTVDFENTTSSPEYAEVGISLDGQHFMYVDQIEDSPQSFSSDWNYHTFTARYLKILCSEYGNNNMQIAEFEVGGEAANILIPAISTSAVNPIGTTTATGNGDITSLGNLVPSFYGICWNTSGNPDCDDDNCSEPEPSISTGPFTVDMTGLTQGTTYYVKAYITDGFSFFYGEEVHFTTDSSIDYSTSTTLESSVNPSVYEQSVTFTASVTASAQGAGTPTGTVSFKNGQAILDNVTLTEGVATYASSSLPVGTHSITAVYNGDSDFLTSTSNTVSQVVNATDNSTTTLLESSVNPSVYEQSVTFTASVTASAQGAGTPTGTVSFKNGQAILDNVTLTEGAATYASSSLPVGTHSITAVYNGESDFLTSTSNTVSQVVNKAGTSTALTSSANPVTYGQSISFTASVTSSVQGAGTPTGTVTFTDGQTILNNVTMTGAQAVYTTSQLTAGAHTIYATYNADAHFSGSTTSLTLTVNTPVSYGGGYNPPSYSTSITLAVAPITGGNTPTATTTPVSPTTGGNTSTATTTPASPTTQDNTRTSTGTINVSILGNQSQVGTNQTSIKITVPPGTTATDSNGKGVTDITVKTVDAASLKLSQFSLPRGTIVLAYEFGPSGTTFSSPITVKCTYDPATLPSGADPSKIKVAVVSPDTGKVTLISGTVDTINHTITFSTNHFSYYLLMVPDEAKPALLPPATSSPVVDTANSAATTPGAVSPVTPTKPTAPFNGPVMWVVICLVVVIVLSLIWVSLKKRKS